MKIRTKLIIAFCIIIIVPVTAACIIFGVVNRMQLNEINSLYVIRGNTGYYMASTIQLLNQITVNEEGFYEEIATDNPQRLTDSEFLVNENERLVEKNCYLILKQGESIVYSGMPKDKKAPEDLTVYSDVYDQGYVGMFIDAKAHTLVKQVNFIADTQQYNLFIVTDFNSVTPRLNAMLLDMAGFIKVF